MKRFFLGLILGLAFVGASAYALSTFLVVQGGTGQSSLTSGNLLYGAGTAGVQSVATGTISASGGITVTANRATVGGATAVACTQADGSHTGCLSSTDWTTFNGKGSVTSVNVSGASTGLTFSGGPITTSGTITMDGVLNQAYGGTGSNSGSITNVSQTLAFANTADTGFGGGNSMTLTAGNGGSTIGGTGGSITITAGNANSTDATNKTGGDVVIVAGNASGPNGVAGLVKLRPGLATGAGDGSWVEFVNPLAPTVGAYVSTRLVTGTGKDFYFPNLTGTIGVGAATTTGQVTYWGSDGSLSNVATGTISASGGVTVTANRYSLNGATAIGCTVADSSNAGCLSSSDWTTFNNKSGFAFPFTQDNNFSTNAVSTTTAIWFKATTNGYSLFASSTAEFSNASTTRFTNSGSTWLTGLTKGGLMTDNNGLVSAFATTTAGTGLTYNTGNPGNFSVNSSQSIATLSNLGTNGVLTTTGGVGTLTVDANGLDVANGGTGAVTLTGCLTGNGTSAITGSGTCATYAYPFTQDNNFSQNAVSTTTAIWFKATPYSMMASSTALFSTVGIGTTSPYYALDVASSSASANTGHSFGQLVLTDNNAGANLKHWLHASENGNLYFATTTDAFATSTKNAFMIDLNGAVGIATSSLTAGVRLGVTGNEEHWGNYYHFGTSNVLDQLNCLSSLNCMAFAGNDNTTNGVNFQVSNSNPGQNAYTFIGLQNDMTDASGAHYAGLAMNSFRYANQSFGTGVGFPGQFQMLNTEGMISLVSGTSTASSTITFLTGGQNTGNEKMRIDLWGHVGVGTSTPWGLFSIASSSPYYKDPLFTVATSTGTSTNIFNIFATTTISQSVSAAMSFVADIGARVGIGSFSQGGFGGLLDHLYVPGRINTGDWLNQNCLMMGPTVASVTVDTGNMPCPGWSFEIDAGGSITLITRSAAGESFAGGINITSTGNLANNGSGVFYAPVANANNFKFSTSTPVMEGTVAIEPYSASTTSYYFGFSNLNSAGSSFEVFPTDGCFFNASSTAQTGDWYAVAVKTGGTATFTDTGIASSSIINFGAAGATGLAGDFYKLRIEADRYACRFYMQPPNSATTTMVANVTTAVSSTTAMTPGIWLGNTTAGLIKGFEAAYVKLWYRDSQFR